MGSGFKALGKDFATQVIQTTSNPIAALMIGLIATSLVQSSSTTTSIIVGLVAAGSLPLHNSVPMLMGANIGTTITNTLVSLGHITRKEEFKRAYAGATIHDFFNLMAVAVLLPIELATGFLEKSAIALSNIVSSFGGLEFSSPIKALIKPGIKGTKHFLDEILHINHEILPWVMIFLSFIILIVSLSGLVKVMRQLVASKSEQVFHKVFGRSAIQSIFVGILFTAFVQSSSITTSILVPLVGAGILSVRQMYPVTLGANVGTTVTALLASMTGNPTAVAVALVHFLFNVVGIIIFYPIKAIRNIPIKAAEILAEWVAERWWIALVYIASVFFIIPGIVLFLTRNLF